MLTLLISLRAIAGCALIIVGLLSLTFRIQVEASSTWPNAVGTAFGMAAFVAIIALGVYLLK